MEKKSRRPSEERPGYTEEETKAVREMMDSLAVPEEVKDEFIRTRAAEMRKNWTEEEKLKRMGFLSPNPDPVEIIEWNTIPERKEVGKAPY